MNGTADYSVLENEQLSKLEGGPRANVQFKPSKKMKKRRQLDALVSNGKKLPRRKHSGHELLRSNDSESSEVEEFSVIERHKWDRRWPSPECCSTCLTLAVVLVVASCILACATVIWMHVQLKQDFNELRDRMELVENRNAGTPEKFQTLQSSLMSMNKTVSDIKKGRYGLEDLNKTIVNMQKQITSLTATTSQLQQTVQSAQPSNNKDTLAVASTVAKLGSDLQTTSAAVDSLKVSEKAFNTKIQELMDRIGALENPGGRESGSLGTAAADLQAALSKLNSTLTQHINQMMADLNRQQTHMDTMDMFTQGLQDQLNNVSQQVVGLTQSQQRLQDLLSQQLTEGSPAERAEDERVPAGPNSPLDQLQQQVGQLKQQFEQMKANQENQTAAAIAAGSSSLSPSVDLETIQKDHVEFVLFKTEVHRDIESLNASLGSTNQTVSTLNQDVEELFNKVAVAMSQISNVTSVVEGLANFLQYLQDDKSTEEGEEKPAAEEQADRLKGKEEEEQRTGEEQDRPTGDGPSTGGARQEEQDRPTGDGPSTGGAGQEEQDRPTGDGPSTGGAGQEEQVGQGMDTEQGTGEDRGEETDQGTAAGSTPPTHSLNGGEEEQQSSTQGTAQPAAAA